MEDIFHDYAVFLHVLLCIYALYTCLFKFFFFFDLLNYVLESTVSLTSWWYVSVMFQKYLNLFTVIALTHYCTELF